MEYVDQCLLNDHCLKLFAPHASDDLRTCWPPMSVVEGCNCESEPPQLLYFVVTLRVLGIQVKHREGQECLRTYRISKP